MSKLSAAMSRAQFEKLDSSGKKSFFRENFKLMQEVANENPYHSRNYTIRNSENGRYRDFCSLTNSRKTICGVPAADLSGKEAIVVYEPQKGFWGRTSEKEKGHEVILNTGETYFFVYPMDNYLIPMLDAHFKDGDLRPAIEAKRKKDEIRKAAEEERKKKFLAQAKAIKLAERKVAEKKAEEDKQKAIIEKRISEMEKSSAKWAFVLGSAQTTREGFSSLCTERPLNGCKGKLPYDDYMGLRGRFHTSTAYSPSDGSTPFFELILENGERLFLTASNGMSTSEAIKENSDELSPYQ